MTIETLRAGGFVPLLEEAIPSVAVAGALFPALPVGCCAVLISIYTGDLRVRWDGVNPTGSTGVRLIGDSPINFFVNYQSLLRARAIGSATGWIQYFGEPK